MKAILISLSLWLLQGVCTSPIENVEIEQFHPEFAPAPDAALPLPPQPPLIPPQPGIVGGRDVTNPTLFPYQVSIQFQHQPGTPWTAFCGGSIMDKDTIITAAHCLIDKKSKFPKDRKLLRVKVGSTTTAEDGTGQFYKVLVIKNHKDYSEDTHANDISMIKLASPISFSSTVREVILPKEDEETAANTMVVASGWGDIIHGPRKGSPILKSVDLRIIVDNCKVRSTELCTYMEGEGQCQGDSGGPLVVKGTRKLIGITSYGIGCGWKGYPAMSTKVSKYIKWIEENKEVQQWYDTDGNPVFIT